MKKAAIGLLSPGKIELPVVRIKLACAVSEAFLGIFQGYDRDHTEFILHH